MKVNHGRLTGWGTGLTTVLTTPVPQPAPESMTVIAITFLDNGTGIAPGDLAGPNSIYEVDYTVYRSWFVANHTYVGMTGNTVTGRTTAGDPHQNVLSNLVGNIFTGNKTAVSYDLGGGSVQDNVFSGDGKALIMTDAGGAVDDELPPVTGNQVSTNTGDGIVISGGAAKMKGNISTFNHGWGINAPGAVDQGGNRAFGNYRSPQCVGVVCTH